MRTTVIPAQITTVEDTIAGNLTLTQILLLLSPVLITTGSYVFLPEQMTFQVYKIVFTILVSLFFVVMSVRIKGKLVANWTVILLAYFSRPKLYLFDKNNSFLRENIAKVKPVKRSQVTVPKAKEIKLENNDDIDFDFQTVARNTEVNLRLTKKGLLLIKNL